MTINERNAVKVVAHIVPWLAPAPSAWLVGRATIAHLDFPLSVAIVTALVIETLGLVSVYNWQWFSDWNRRKLKTDTPARPWQPALLGIFYLILTIGLIVILDVLPALTAYAPATFPLLAMVGTINLALIAGQEGREARAEADKAERKQRRQERKADTDRTLTGQAGRWPDKAAFLSDPDRTTVTVSALVTDGVHPRTARRWVAEAKDGHHNGQEG